MTSHGDRFTILETDEANQPIASYVYSEQNVSAANQAVPIAGRLDVMHSSSSQSSWSTKPIIDYLSDVFLPAGYPQSVSEDYLPYQIFDSLQAFCSSIAGLLSSRAVLQGVGVGNADASPTSALLLHILQDTSGRIATILFAHRVGTALEPECKTYRLAADVFNDVAMILDCLSPMVPAGVMRVSVLSTAGVLRALCGVAGGSSKASLSAHFAKWGNLAELNAKDSSQETVISLIGMLVGSVVVSRVNGFITTWVALLTLLALHLSLNYAAVRSVQMTSLNRQRANIVFSTLLDSDPDLDLEYLRTGEQSKPNQAEPSTSRNLQALTPAQVAQQEHVFPHDGALEWTSSGKGKETLGTASIGVSLPTFLQATSTGASTTSKTASIQTSTLISTLTILFTNEAYLLTLTPEPTPTTRNPKCHASILLKNPSTVHIHQKAWMHALLSAKVLSEHTPTQSTPEITLDIISRTLTFLNQPSRTEKYTSVLKDAGWALDIAALETKPGRRVTFQLTTTIN